MRSTIFLSLSLCLFLVGCRSVREYPITEFPPEPKLEEYVEDPIIKYINPPGNYLVTKTFIKNTVLKHKFLEEIKKWRRDNDLR